MLLDYFKCSQSSDDGGKSQLLEARNETDMTALLIASLKKDKKIIELLIEFGSDVKAADQNGNTAIILAASIDNVKEIISLQLIIHFVLKLFLLDFIK